MKICFQIFGVFLSKVRADRYCFGYHISLCIVKPSLYLWICLYLWRVKKPRTKEEPRYFSFENSLISCLKYRNKRIFLFYQPEFYRKHNIEKKSLRYQILYSLKESSKLILCIRIKQGRNPKHVEITCRKIFKIIYIMWKNEQSFKMK